MGRGLVAILGVPCRHIVSPRFYYAVRVHLFPFDRLDPVGHGERFGCVSSDMFTRNASRTQDCNTYVTLDFECQAREGFRNWIGGCIAAGARVEIFVCRHFYQGTCGSCT